MALLLNQSTLNAYLRHVYASAPGYPITIALKVITSGTGATGDYLNLTAPGGSQTANLIRSYFAANGSSFGWGSRTSWGSSTEEIAGGQGIYGVSNLVTDTGATFKNVFIVAPSNTSAWTLFNEDNPTGRTFTPNNGASGEFAQCTDLLIGAFLNLGAFSNHARIAVAELAVWTDARTQANYASYAANTAAETINPASLYDVWDLNPAGAAGSSVTGTLTGLVNGRALTVNGTVVKAYQAHPVSRAPATPVITGPTGAAGAASITHAVNELQNNAGTWSATGGSAWSLTGTDAGLLSISAGGVVTLASGNFDRETKASYSFNVLRDAVAQAVTLNINNVNEAPTFSGPDISVPGLVVGTAMGSINAALLFADPDSGDTGTYSAVGTWPAGITVSSAGLISGTPTTAGTSSNLRVRRTDVGGLTADSNLFSITVSASSTPVSFTGTVGSQSGTEGTSFSWAGSALASFFSGTLTPFSYSISAGSLPPGLSLNASTGVVSGTPTTAGSYAATFRATDTGTNTATSNSVAFTIAAAPPPPPPPPSGHDVGPIFNNTYSAPLEGTTVHFSWYANGRIGSLTGITPTEGTGVVGSDGMLAIAPSGPGCVFVAKRNADATTDDVFYQAFAS